jgi:hypothetical protein
VLSCRDVFMANCQSKEARKDLGQKSRAANANNATTGEKHTHPGHRSTPDSLQIF